VAVNATVLHSALGGAVGHAIPIPKDIQTYSDEMSANAVPQKKTKSTTRQVRPVATVANRVDVNAVGSLPSIAETEFMPDLLRGPCNSSVAKHAKPGS
jgi:hypothetical protein